METTRRRHDELILYCVCLHRNN